MPTGTVKWFNNAKGYGFILADEKNEDLFAHYSAIQMEGYRTLKAGQRVDFDIIKGEKGLHAANIRALNSYDANLQPQGENFTDSATSLHQEAEVME
ncbi:MAG: cold shock domain-containing protein CspD [Gammaproteobacteria bacterium]|nr:cold shock domain-containing protein CspD [Gammaproteobacteria bacterium]